MRKGKKMPSKIPSKPSKEEMTKWQTLMDRQKIHPDNANLSASTTYGVLLTIPWCNLHESYSQLRDKLPKEIERITAYHDVHREICHFFDEEMPIEVFFSMFVCPYCPVAKIPSPCPLS